MICLVRREKVNSFSIEFMTDLTYLLLYNVSQSNKDKLLMPKSGYIASAVVLGLIGVIGFTFNLTVIIRMRREKQLWTPLNIILFNMVCCDFSVSILGSPWTFISALFHKWIFGQKMCIIYGFFMALLGINSIGTLTVLAFERYIMVSRPIRSNHLDKNGALLIIFGTWIYSLALTIPPIIGWGEYVNESANISCSVNWEEKSLNSTTYMCYLFAFGFFVPLVVITFSYISIFGKLKENALATGQVKKAERRITLMIFLMIAAFLLAWTPYAIMALIVHFGDETIISPGMKVVPALLAKSSICYNPMIYVGLNPQFKIISRAIASNASETVMMARIPFHAGSRDVIKESPVNDKHTFNKKNSDLSLKNLNSDKRIYEL